MKAAWLYIFIGCAVLAGCGRSPSPGRTPPRAPPALTTTATTPHRIPAIPGGPTGPAHAPPTAQPDAAPPVRLIIPSIGVDTSIEPVGLLLDSTLQPPSAWGVAGWYANGPRPGDPGPAVIEGHVDSVNGPAVFYRLRDLRTGAAVTIRTSNGTTLHFVVDTARRYPKTKFPTEAVYGPTPLPELRLITCTGDFDWSAHSYLDNLVVSARLA
jgi:hypothetical protein